MCPSCTGVLLSNNSMGTWLFQCLLGHICIKFTCRSVHTFSSPGLVAEASRLNTGNSCSPLAFASCIHIVLSQGWNSTQLLSYTSLHSSVTDFCKPHTWPETSEPPTSWPFKVLCPNLLCLSSAALTISALISIYFHWDDRGQSRGPGPLHPTPGRTTVLEETALRYLDWNICVVQKTNTKCTNSGVAV